MESEKGGTVEGSPDTTHDERDGNNISGTRRRGVTVTGKYLPPLEWEQVRNFQFPSTLDHCYIQSGYADLENTTDFNLQKTSIAEPDAEPGQKEHNSAERIVNPEEDMSHSLDKAQKEKKIAITQEEKKDDTSREEEGDAQDQSQKTEAASKVYNQNTQQKGHAQSIPAVAVISKNTIEELKDLLRESSLITRDGDQHNIASTFMLLPKSSEKLANKKERPFETFRPHNEEEEQKIKTGQENDVKWSNAAIQRQACNVYEEHQSPDGKAIKGSSSKQPTDSLVSSSTGPGDSSRGTEMNTTDLQRPSHLIPQVEQIKQQIDRENIHFVRFEATDLHGVSRSKTIPSRFFQEKANYGVFMPRSFLELTLNPKDNEVDSISASNYNGDIVLLPDLSTFRVIPWADKMARVICDSYSIRGNPLLTSPRHIVKRQLSQLQESGLSLYSAFTYEFCIYGVAEVVNSKTIFLPAATLLNDHDQPFIQQLIDGMYHIGANIESFSASTGPGQVEVSFHPEFGIRVADNAFTFRTGMKEVAKKNGYIASFFTESGFYNCGVLSHSLWDRGERRNLFHSGSTDLTDIGKKWLSGLLLHSPALSCLVAPGVSCRKRFLKEGKELQEVAEVTCGTNDNSCAYNVKCHGLKGPHIENNLGSATANPYLVLAATIAAGLDGVRRGLSAFDGVAHAPTLKMQSATVPLKLEDALTALKEDSCIKAALGEAFVQYFIAMKQYELETEELDTERNKFLEYFI